MIVSTTNDLMELDYIRVIQMNEGFYFFKLRTHLPFKEFLLHTLDRNELIGASVECFLN